MIMSRDRIFRAASKEKSRIDQLNINHTVYSRVSIMNDSNRIEKKHQIDYLYKIENAKSQ